MPSLILNVKAWHGDGELELQLPDTWQLNVLAPDDAEGLAPSAVEAALERPIGSPSLEELARDKASALIVVDDLGRPTRADRVIPTLLAMLTRAGVGPDGISFLVATGSHRPLREEEIRQKLGSDVATRFPVANHDAFAHDLRHLGTLPSGLPIIVNRRIAEVDLVVGIGCVIPHSHTGFSGGGIQDNGYEVSHPGKVLVRKVIDNVAAPATETLLSDVSSYLEAPDGGSFSGPGCGVLEQGQKSGAYTTHYSHLEP